MTTKTTLAAVRRLLPDGVGETTLKAVSRELREREAHVYAKLQTLEKQGWVRFVPGRRAFVGLPKGAATAGE